MNSKRVLLVQTRELASIGLINRMIAEALRAAGHKVTFLYLETGLGVPALGEVISLNLNKKAYAGLRLQAKAALRDFFATREFDVIVANMFKPIELLGRLQQVLGRARVIGLFAAFGEFDRLSRRLAFRWFDKRRFTFVAPSQALLDYLIAKRAGITAQNSCCIVHALDIAAADAARLAPSAARAVLGLADGKRWLGTVGRLVDDKQQDALIRAFSHISAAHPEVNLAIIGEGEARAYLTQLIASLNLSERVVLVGARAQAANFLAAFDVFVFPSKSEGFGLALLEAMAAGVPVIANRIEPLQSILSDAGYVVDVTDTKAFAAKLDECLSSDTETLGLRAAQARARAESVFGVAQFQQSFCRLIEGDLI